jgi:hypothetical protein
MRTLRRATSLVLTIGCIAVCGCGSNNDLSLPTPAPQVQRLEPTLREWNERVKPGVRASLYGTFQATSKSHTFEIINLDTFSWNLLDDLWLWVGWRSADGPVSGGSLHANLRCPTPRLILPGARVEISMDTCRAISAEPGPWATITGYSIVAKEGSLNLAMEPGFPLVRDTAPSNSNDRVR